MEGFGWSDKPEDSDYTPQQLREEVNAWMDAMGLEKVVFVGNSLGGEIAWNMALEHPDKVKNLGPHRCWRPHERNAVSSSPRGSSRISDSRKAFSVAG